MAKEEKGPPIREGDPRLKEVQMSDEAFSVAKSKDGKYFLVALEFDLESGQAKVTERLLQGSRGEAFERFKIRVAQSRVMGE